MLSSDYPDWYNFTIDGNDLILLLSLIPSTIPSILAIDLYLLEKNT